MSRWKRYTSPCALTPWTPSASRDRVSTLFWALQDALMAAARRCERERSPRHSYAAGWLLEHADHLGHVGQKVAL